MDPRATRRITAEEPFRIESPRIGFWNLLGEGSSALLEEDRRTIGSLFPHVDEGVSGPPLCHVLMLYCRILGDGSVEGTRLSLGEIIRVSQAPVVVIASENDGDSYIQAAGMAGAGGVNLVMTLSRNGAEFGEFFGRLFRMMFQGRSMPVAWVELAPQIPGDESRKGPATIFACGAGHVAFQK